MLICSFEFFFAESSSWGFDYKKSIGAHIKRNRSTVLKVLKFEHQEFGWHRDLESKISSVGTIIEKYDFFEIIFFNICMIVVIFSFACLFVCSFVCYLLLLFACLFA